jgi:ABC-type transporter Mla subunit MlaD
MDQQTLLTVMTVFVCISAIALLIQAGLLFGIYRASRGMQETVQRVMPKVESLIETSRQTIEDSRKQIRDITSKTNEILDTARKQLKRVDEVMEDATARAHVQIARADLLIDDAIERANQTVATVHGGIMRPLREIQGLAAGLRTAFVFLMRGRPNPTEATADEEMFI